MLAAMFVAGRCKRFHGRQLDTDLFIQLVRKNLKNHEESECILFVLSMLLDRHLHHTST